MLDAAGIAALIPHQGRMCLLDRAEWWNAVAIRCRATSHLDSANPLRRDGMLPAVCALEYGLQAAALHGALLDGARAEPGRLASLRDIVLYAGRVDDPAHATLRVDAKLLLREPLGLIYEIAIAGEGGAMLASGRVSVALPSSSHG